MKKVKVVRTAKLRAAVEILADERNADCSDDAFFSALQDGKLKPQDIYQVMATMRYTWNAKYRHWSFKPRWMKKVKRVFAIVRKIEDARFLEAAL